MDMGYDYHLLRWSESLLQSFYNLQLQGVLEFFSEAVKICLMGELI